MGFDRQPLLQTIRSTRPRCLAAFKCQFDERPAIAQNGYVYSGWKIMCKCGCVKGKLLGTKVADEPYLEAPLTFECAACRTRTELLDPRKDGYGGELHPRDASLASGAVNSPFECPACFKRDFGVSCVFIIPDAAFDLVEDDLLEETGFGYGERIQDLFDQFSAECTCAACNTRVFAASMELK